jgi:hypothetical protein
MELVTKPVGTDLEYKAFFKESIIDQSVDEPRLALIKKIQKNFDIRFNDIKFDGEFASERWMNFSKFYGSTWFAASIGFEQVSANLREPIDEIQVKDLYFRLDDIIGDFGFSTQMMTIHHQLMPEGDLSNYLNSLNPYTPKGFIEILDARGSIFKIRIAEHNLSINIVATNSIIFEKGLYVNMGFEFAPNKYDFKNAFGIIEEYYKVVLEELNLTIVRED